MPVSPVAERPLEGSHEASAHGLRAPNSLPRRGATLDLRLCGWPCPPPPSAIGDWRLAIGFPVAGGRAPRHPRNAPRQTHPPRRVAEHYERRAPPRFTAVGRRVSGLKARHVIAQAEGLGKTSLPSIPGLSGWHIPPSYWLAGRHGQRRPGPVCSISPRWRANPNLHTS